MKPRKYILLHENMVDDEGRIIFEADIPYKVKACRYIKNDNCVKVDLKEIWVGYEVQND